MAPLQSLVLATGVLATFASAQASAVSVSTPPASSAYVFTTINSDGSNFTDVRGINNSGQIVGYNGSGSFLYSGGAFTTLANPSGYFNSALALNDRGVIVGGASNAAFTGEQGSIYSGGTYALYSHPGYAYTEFRGVNNAGLISGIAYNEQSPSSTQAFLFNPATQVYTDLSLPAANYSIVNQINSAGQIVGSTRTPDYASNRAFVANADGTINYFTVGGNGARARAINDTGLIAGSLYGSNQGFVASASGYQLLNVPGATGGTYIESINNAGQVSGFYANADFSVTLGFLATLAVLPLRTDANGAFVFGVDVTQDVPIFIDPAIATGYDYAIGAGDPNFSKVTLPIGIGDSLYTITVGGRTFTVSGGKDFDFVANGFTGGVSAFEVTGIETSAGLDPLNPDAFVTELTFVASGRFTGTQRALVTNVPEPHVIALGLLAFASGSIFRRRARR